MSYQVQLDVFEGPIDLLLSLIGKRRVDIYDVPLAAITDEYLGAVAGMTTVDLETSTGFLVVAAALLELKSARLLPRDSEQDDSQASLLEQRDLLLARLLECATYRAAGGWMGAQLRRGEARHPRFAALPPDLARAVARRPLELREGDLVAVASRLLAPHPSPEIDTSYIPPTVASVRQAIAEVGTRLSTDGDATFVELCSRSLGRAHVVVRFLALLELYKAGAVDLRQAECFGDIVASWTGETDVGEVLELAEEYAVEEEV
jgi:segregation and condensation protein A